MEHYELVQEMASLERMGTQERLKHARKRRAQQMKKWGQYEKQLEKDSSKKKKQDKTHGGNQPNKRPRKPNKGNVQFVPNVSLLEAAARNDLTEVKRLLESGVSPDVTNADGLTALHQCCIDDSEEMMKLLLDFNANVNACDSEMWTPLHAAATCGHVNLCKHLIDRGAKLLAVNADGNMPYDICEDEVTLDHIENEMSNRGITQEQIDTTRLATEHKMLEDIKEYASQGGDLDRRDRMGATLLHVAAANDYINVAEFLLDNHVSVDLRDNDSWQPIHAAAYWAQLEMLEMLVENGADLDSKTKNGETPFDLCEDPDMKQRILDLKDEIESKRVIRQQRQGSNRKQHRVSSRNASLRRSSMRGERKSDLFKKEHKEEALHFGLNLMRDEESLLEAEEEHETSRVTDLDEVTIVVPSDPNTPTPSPPLSQEVSVTDGPQPSAPGTGTGTVSGAVTTINIGSSVKPVPKPRTQASIPPASVPVRPANQPAPQRKEPTPAPPPNPVKPAIPNASNPGGQTAPPPASSSERRQSTNTLSDLKKHRSNSRENLLDTAVQNMFLESVHSGRQTHQQRAAGSSPANATFVAGGDKAKNGHNNNNAVYYSARDGHIHRFVAPTNSPVVGGDEEDKEKCCVIL